MTALSLPVELVREQVSLRRRAIAGARAWLHAHARSLLVMVPLVILTAAVHLTGSENFPRYVDDPGTYLSQAWSVRYEGELSPYSYFYDHAPAGWLQIAAWALLTDGFDRYSSSIAFGTECMLIAKLFSAVLIFALVRRLGFSRATASLATALFALSPLAVVYGRWTFLDNIAVPWLLASFYLVASPRRSIGAAIGACSTFAMAALSKETFLVFLPAFAWAFVRNLDRRNRAQVATVAVFAGGLLMAMYPLMALYKGELFPGPGHNSLLGTAQWQLAGRASTGSLLDGASEMRRLFGQWQAIDGYLLWGGVAASILGLLRPNLRPIVLALATGWLVMMRDGYVPFMHVIALLPFSAILIATGVEVAVERIGRHRFAAHSYGLLIVLVVATVAWSPTLRDVTGAHEMPALRAATLWAARNIPRDKQLVVHDTIWTDLVQRYGFEPRPIIAHKLDSDPEVAEGVHRIDYLIVPNWYYNTGDAAAYPTLIEARRHAVPAASFGEGDDGVRVYRVSAFWAPS